MTLTRRALAAALLLAAATAGTASAIQPIPPIPYSCRIDYVEPPVQHDIPGVPPVPRIPSDVRCYG
jgi:hypothetical protein